LAGNLSGPNTSSKFKVLKLEWKVAAIKYH
jgi:hypothetical protein